MLTLVPLGIALALVANAVVHDIHLGVSVSYALVLVGFSVIVTRHSLAQLRLAQLQSSVLRGESTAD